ncbi:MAG: hypothetical protein PHO48_00575 [Candidatus Gracilibacteria bacterium]|nr:hypothetical protein [Candidatus Gracilibacteria bacterium]MDD5178760.1 hypothetical protein [Candidatus Gracilibacteria bacterium]
MTKELLGLWDVSAMLREGKTPQEIAAIIFPQMEKRMKELETKSSSKEKNDH